MDHRFSFTVNTDNPDRLDELMFTSGADGINDLDSGKSGERKPSGDNEVEDSDVSAPKLWDHFHHPPTSRALAITGYRKEMMELMRDVPESVYELSLKDLVESPRMEAPPKADGKVKKRAAPRRMSRTESMDAGVFLLKMFMPFSLGGRKRGKSSRRSNRSVEGSSEVSPKPASSDRSSSSGSSSSCSSTSSSINRKLTSCLSFFLDQKSKGGSICE